MNILRVIEGEKYLLKGIGVSDGIVIGKAYLLGRNNTQIAKRYIKKSEINEEIQRFIDAVSESISQLLDIKRRAKYDVKSDHLFILDTHLMILRDDVMIDDIVTSIQEKNVSAEWAIKNFLDRFTRLFEKIGDEYFKGKKTDIEHIAIRMINNLTGLSQESLSEVKEPVVIIANDLTPSDTLQIDRKKVLGFVTDVGGHTSHTAILAAALSIPAVVGLKDITSRVSSGDAIIIDGSEGIVVVRPGKEIFKKYLKRQQKYKYYEKELFKLRDSLSETIDGYRVKLMANIGHSEEVLSAINYGAEGVGLYRTEYGFMNRKRLPTEEELFSDYRMVAERLTPMPVIIRTIDIGGDKFIPHMDIARKTNPALGLRAIRLCLSYVKIFKAQLRGILRASNYGNLKIMYPMISDMDELTRAKEILEEVKDELRKNGAPFDENIQTGITVETPSAAIIADHLAKEVDFFSIGTNDLIQYSMAADRGDEQVSYLYQPFHPAILRLVQGIILSANRENIDVAVCGGMGSDPNSVFILMGLGRIQSLSMDSHAIPKIKKLIQVITIKEAGDAAKRVLTFRSAKEISCFISSYIRDNFSCGFEWNN